MKTTIDNSPPVPIQLVWLKRDLRIADHRPLARAARTGPCLVLYVYEPELLTHPTTDAAHLRFINGSLAELDRELRRRGARLTTRVGNLPEVFDRLHAERPIARIWSHEETGLGITYARDRRVRAWAKRHGVDWIELPNHGVFRPHPERDGWAGRWRRRMAEPVTPAPKRICGIDDIPSDGLKEPVRLHLEDRARPEAAAPGSAVAERVLGGFLNERGLDYRQGMSSPVTAWTASSRLSPHLAWGNLSVRQVFQATQARLEALGAYEPRGRRPVVGPEGAWIGALDAFAKRLHWHCHFIQKLEDQPDIELRNLSRACDGLRDERPNRALLAAWEAGQTGYPLVDACMRALAAGGWINFRMRAMLMSFAAHHLWQHWREPALHLARLFLDFEPGIHFSQVQMQSGTTGINAVRIYSPVKQVRDQDPRGLFIRRWCPELAGVPDAWLPRPETMPAAVQQAAGCIIGRHYPRPIVDNGPAYLSARRRLLALRSRGAARAEAARIQHRHGSRKGPRRAAVAMG
jgi:deoxyribodipyrimidine photo-lyase